jgi:hypothetical protein
MTLEELEYRIKLNMLRAKYSKDPMQAIALCIDSAITGVEVIKNIYRSNKLSKFQL